MWKRLDMNLLMNNVKTMLETLDIYKADLISLEILSTLHRWRLVGPMIKELRRNKMTIHTNFLILHFLLFLIKRSNLVKEIKRKIVHVLNYILKTLKIEGILYFVGYMGV